MTTTPEIAIRRANELFYEALAAADLTLMASLWVQNEKAKCTHPGWDVLLGWAEIYASWTEIFARDYHLEFAITEFSVQIVGTFAAASCTENITVFAHETHQRTTVILSATKLFQRHDAEWLLLHHHVTPAPLIVHLATSNLMHE